MFENILSNLKKLNIDTLALIMGILGHLAPYIQAMKMFQMSSCEAISLTATLVSFLSTLCWVMYGMIRHLMPVALSSIFGLIGLTLILLEIFYYRH